MEKLQIKLSRSTPKVKHKIFQLLHKQEANLVFNHQDNLYHVDLKIASCSREILDQIAKSLTQTIEEAEDRNDYSFSRVLDPLEIYEGNIKTDSKVNYEALEQQISEAIQTSFLMARTSITNRHNQQPREEVLNPEHPTGGQFREFLDRKLSMIRAEDSIAIIEEQSQSLEDSERELSQGLSVSRVMPQKMSLQTSGSFEMLSYLRRVVRGGR